MRLIDADKAISDYAHYGIHHSYDAYDLENILTECPTIKAIPKAEYENRLKADMSAILDKIKNDILEKAFTVVNPNNTYEYINVLDLEGIEKIIDKYMIEREN